MKGSKNRTTKIRVMAERALQLDPTLAEAHATLGFVCREEYDLRGAEQEFKKAIEQRPSYATAHQWYFWILRSELRWSEALNEIEKAVELDPLSAVINLNFGDYYFARKDFSRAAEKYRIAVELGGDNNRGQLGAAYGMMKMYDRMEREIEAMVRFFQDILPGIKTAGDAYMAYFRGDKETLRMLLPEVEAHAKETNVPASEIGSFYFFLGDDGKGFEWLERAYSRREASLLDIQWSWDLDGVRTDPRYLDLLKKLGLSRAAEQG
jgi:tetratricopeptide (TPR) repeat protein